MLDIIDNESIYTESTGYIQFQCEDTHENIDKFKFAEIDASLFVIFQLDD